MKDNNWLIKYRSNITSQSGEDGVINKIFEVLPPINKWCVEFGAHNGQCLSNTWNLVANKKWLSIQIESDANLYKKLAEEYNTNDSVFCLNRTVGFKSPNLLDEILNPYEIPYNFDFLSIDVDGFDYQIWKAFVKYQPRVVCIESYPDHGGKSFIHGGTEPRPRHAGSSVSSMVSLGKKKGYELISIIGVNAFFVLKDLYPLFEAESMISPQIVEFVEYTMKGTI